MPNKFPANPSGKNIVIFYHAFCTDGFGGAYAAWKKFGSRAAYIPMEHGKPLPVLPKGKEIYFIDIIAPQTELSKLMRSNKKVTAIEHHISKKDLVMQTDEYLYALNHSGATLAWQYFHGKRKSPRLLTHIEDEDLWQFKKPFTREICAALRLKDFDFMVWDKFMRALEKPVDKKKIIKQGSLMLACENKLIKEIAEGGAQPVKFQGIQVYAVNSPIFESELGNLLNIKYPPMAIVWSEKDGSRKVSLRSNGQVNVSEIAKKFGGGGHVRAAAFKMDIKKPVPWKLL